MSEGGVFPWKVQKIELPKYGRYASVSYADLSRPLPDPPEGRTWARDASTREWKLIPLVLASASAHPVAVARVQGDADVDPDADGSLITAVPVIIEAAAAPVDEDRGAPSGSRYHEVLPTDTFQGICLRYKVTPTELRRANTMVTASDLKLAPEMLVIPSNEKNVKLDARYRCPTREEKIAMLVFRVSRVTGDKLTYPEAMAYLEMADGDVEGAVANVHEDFGWSAEEEKKATLVAKVSRITRDRLTDSEVRAYLETTNWDLSAALDSIREDFGMS
jgi:hypothetical protein